MTYWSSVWIKENFDVIPKDVKDRFYNSMRSRFQTDDLEKKLCLLRREKVERAVVYIGAGTCGFASGADKTIPEVKKYIKEKKLDIEVIEVGCVGICSLEPLFDIQLPGKNRLSFQKITEDKVKELLDNIFAESVPVNDLLGQYHQEGLENWDNLPYINDHPFFKLQVKCVLENCGVINPVDINEYIAHGGYSALLKTIHTITPNDLCDYVESSGLRGRGGGGFPTGRKWKLALGTDSDQKYVICNADEGDPGAFMDRAIIEGDPHKLIEGLAIAAYGIGASKAYIYIRAEYPLAIKNLKKAINDAMECGIIGEDIYGSGVNLDIVIKMGAGAFVCGEETALIHSIEGKRGMPRPRPPYPTTSGLFGKPTVINNVETLANVPLIVSRGADWFSSMGVGDSKGTKVFSISGKIKRSGLVEIPMGTSLRDIIYKIGGGIENDNEFKAVQMGGPSGGCIPAENLDVSVDYESLKEIGAMVGSGGLVVMDNETCMVDVAKFFMDFIQRESCGKCIPCREGTRSMLEILNTITRGRSTEKDNDALKRFKGIMHLERLANVIKDTSLCGLGQTAPNPVLSTLKWFRNEYEEHIYERKCRARVCKELLTYTIDVDKCVGCTLCAKKCPVGAIWGDKNGIHTIEQSKCIACGACFQACRLDAVIRE
ncbi:MAG: 4Fe-4S binding protein [Bacteriovoracaceae bacterium]|nr:4Fe-4S binding protein [Bacteriovoracaceae bacterium]